MMPHLRLKRARGKELTTRLFSGVFKDLHPFGTQNVANIDIAKSSSQADKYRSRPWRNIIPIRNELSSLSVESYRPNRCEISSQFVMNYRPCPW
ncbi:hypothetical protein CHS0354_012370 [Potamilus streckersoni]|uniref:Uncharacterized protein n=1 Tax=Potamilus streckersoni TaxID=2493646 RepID=A0AAE0SK95_9BIVA|nr:hypothetical protein CHS0354_012370 [Potamilus streckersoni]